MDLIPPEIIVNILSFLSPMELITNIMKVCKRWKQLATAPSLWLKVNECNVLPYLKNNTSICDSITFLQTNHENLSKFTKHSPECYFKSLRQLDISSIYLTKLNIKLITEFILKCPVLLSISIRFDDRILFQDLFQVLCKSQIEDLLINYSGSDEQFLFTLELLSRHSFIKTISVHCDTIQNNTVSFLFENFSNIKTCDVTSKYLKNETFLKMRRMRTLTSLNIDYTRVDDKGLKHISMNIPNLKTFSVKRCDRITDNGFVFLSQHCPLLQQVNISELHTISGVTLTSLANGCSNLRCLSVMACSQIDDVGVTSLVTKCSQLRILVLNFCIQLTDDSLTAIGENCSLLRKLDIGHNGKFTSAGVCCILLSCRWLEFFGFACCDGIAELKFPTRIKTEICNAYEELTLEEIKRSNWDVDKNDDRQTNGSELLTSQHSHVRTITMSHTSVSNSAVLELSLLCPDLRKLYMFGCKNVTTEIIHSLFKNCIFMERISIQSKSFLRESQLAEPVVHTCTIFDVFMDAC